MESWRSWGPWRIRYRRSSSWSPPRSSPPKIGTGFNIEFIKGVGKHQDQFILILDIDKVFSVEELTTLKEAESAPIAPREVENVFSEVRAGKLKVTPDLIALTLDARDVIRELLADGNQSRRHPELTDNLLELFKGMLTGAAALPVAAPAEPQLRTYR